MPERTYMSIGDVLALLREEFPDITISKIRFLESRGLLVPERTPSGYRKFYDQDVDRLRWILRQQREHFLPLKVIKGRLEGQDPGSERQHLFDVPQGAEAHGHEERNGTPPTSTHAPTYSRATAGATVGATVGTAGGTAAGEKAPGSDPDDESGREELAAAAFAASTAAAHKELRHLAEESVARSGAAGERGGVATATPPVVRTTPLREKSGLTAGGGEAATGETTPGREREERQMGESDRSGAPAADTRQATRGQVAPPATDTRGGADSKRADGGASHSGPTAERKSRRTEEAVTRTSGAAFSANELASASGLSVELVEDLENFGLISGRNVAGVHCFDEEALGIASLAAHFARFGVEARHLRIFKHAAERQAGLYSQVVMPVLRQRNPEARQRASDDLARLAELGGELQASFVRSMLRNFTGG